MGATMTARTRVHMDDVEWLLECHPRMTSTEMGPRFDVKPATVMTAIRRAGRMDLLDNLVRNSELAGHNVKRAS